MLIGPFLIFYLIRNRRLRARMGISKRDVCIYTCNSVCMYMHVLYITVHYVLYICTIVNAPPLDCCNLWVWVRSILLCRPMHWNKSRRAARSCYIFTCNIQSSLWYQDTYRVVARALADWLIDYWLRWKGRMQPGGGYSSSLFSSLVLSMTQ